jgi:hypothetical protein
LTGTGFVSVFVTLAATVPETVVVVEPVMGKGNGATISTGVAGPGLGVGCATADRESINAATGIARTAKVAIRCFLQGFIIFLLSFGFSIREFVSGL